MTIHHLRPHKSVNTAAWIAEADEAIADASGVVVMALYDDDEAQTLRISYCNLNEQQLTWAVAKLQDFVAAQRCRDEEDS